jgi:hypothetical protein
VISNNYNIFESALADVFTHHMHIRDIPAEYAKTIYWNMAENQRSAAITKIFEIHEEDPKTIVCVNNLLSYFKWCEDCRNKIIHSKPHDPIFNKKDDMLYIAKRSKKAPKLSYGILDLTRLRKIADQTHAGYEYCFDLSAYLMQRDYVRESLPLYVRALLHDTLPEIPQPPKPLELSDTDHIQKVPVHLRPPPFSTFQPRRRQPKN